MTILHNKTLMSNTIALKIKNNLIQPVVELTAVNNKNKSRTEVSRETLTVIFLQHFVILLPYYINVAKIRQYTYIINN